MFDDHSVCDEQNDSDLSPNITVNELILTFNCKDQSLSQLHCVTATLDPLCSWETDSYGLPLSVCVKLKYPAIV